MPLTIREFGIDYKEIAWAMQGKHELQQNRKLFRYLMTSKVGGNSDSRRQTGRDSEIAPTNMKSYKKQQNYHVTSTSRNF